MSLDTTQAKPLTVANVASVMRRAELDTDPVSMACNGTSFLDSGHATQPVKEAV